MNSHFRWLLFVLVTLGLATWSPGRPAVAQAPPAEAKDVVEPAADAPEEQPLREQNIYVPYEQLREVFEKHGRGVFLPYEKFQELWKAARQQTAPPAEPKPPVGAVITEIDSEATVAKDVVRVNATLKIEVLAEGWNEVNLRLADAAITAATIEGEPARIIGSPGQHYKLLVEKQGKDPKQIELKLQYARAITRMPGQNSVSFQAPQAPVNHWRVRIPESGVKVEIQPLIAATDQADAEPGEEEAAEPVEETVLLAYVGAAPTVRIDWTPKSEGATGMAALASVQAEQQIWVNEGVTRTRTRLAYSISRAELPQLTIDVPTGHSVVNVFDANVRQWSVEEVDGKQRITAQLFEPAKGSQEVTVELEKFTDEKPDEAADAAAPTPATEIEVPVVRAVDADRQQGVVVVGVAGGLRVEAARTSGLLQVDANELPGSLQGGAWAFAYRYATVPFELVLTVEKVEPRILVDSLVEAYLEPELLSIDVSSIFFVQRAGIFRLEFDLPAGYEIRQVVGHAIGGAEAVEVDAFHTEGENDTRLVVNLARKAKADQRVGVLIKLEKDLDEADLLTPTGRTVTVPLEIPRVAPETVERATGRLVVYKPESLRVYPGATEGLQDVSLEEALEGMQSARSRKPAGVRPALKFAYTQETVALDLVAERRKPDVTIEQMLVARIDDRVVNYESTFFYTVRYSPAKTLTLDVPADVAAKLPQIEPTSVQKKVLDNAEGVPEGYVRWELTGERELIGKGQIKLVWKEKIEESGKSVDLALPYIKPVGADLASGQIVLTKAETLDVVEKDAPEWLQPIDPQHELLAPVEGAARAFEFHDDWNLTVTVTRYELEEVKRTNIELGVLRMVVTRAGQIPVQALYRIRSYRQQLEIELPEEASFDTAPLLNGRRIPLQKEQGKYFITLAETDSEESFLLELRYTMPGDGRRFDPPSFPEEPSVEKLYLCVFQPTERLVLGYTGPWTKEFEWRLDGSGDWRPKQQRFRDANKSEWVGLDEHLVGKVAGDPGLVGDFPTDGELYVFSTLRPEPPPEGSLRVRVADDVGLHVVVFAAVFVLGILLLPVATPNRALVVGGVIVGLILVGVLAPTFALQVLDGVFVSAVFAVFVLWIVWYFWRTRPKQLAHRERTQRSVPPPAASFRTPSDAGHEIDTGGQPTEAEKPPAEPKAEEEKPKEGESGEEGKEGGKTDA